MLRRAKAGLSRQTHCFPRPWRRRPGLLRASLAAGSLCGGWALLLLAPGPASAKQGMVITKDQKHTAFIGDINENAAPGKVDVSTAESGKVSIDSRNVERVVYFNTPREELDARWATLGAKDVNGRVALAKFAYDNKMYEQAHDILASAIKIEPTNRQALDLQQRVDEQIKVAHPPPATAPVVPAPVPVARPSDGPAKRKLTADEINQLRQIEWQANDNNVQVLLVGDTKRAALDLGLAQPNESNAQIGWAIVHNGPPELRKGVKLNSDPSVLLGYKQQVQRFVVATCASTQCHNTDKGGKLYLFTAPNTNDDASALTDYVILQQFTKTIGGVEYPMIDRLHPDDSLLVQYSLPANVAKLPHPKAAGYTPPARVNSVQIKQIEDWIGKLAPVAPTYDFDLTKEPKKEKEEGKGAEKTTGVRPTPKP